MSDQSMQVEMYVTPVLVHVELDYAVASEVEILDNIRIEVDE